MDKLSKHIFYIFILFAFYFNTLKANGTTFELKCEGQQPCNAPDRLNNNTYYKILVDGEDKTEDFKTIFDLDVFHFHIEKESEGVLSPKNLQICFPESSYRLLLKSLLVKLEISDDEDNRTSLESFLNIEIKEYLNLTEPLDTYLFNDNHYDCYLPIPKRTTDLNGTEQASNVFLDEKFSERKRLNNFPLDRIKILHNSSLNCYNYGEEITPKEKTSSSGSCTGLNLIFSEREDLRKVFKSVGKSDEMVGKTFQIPSGYWVKGIDTGSTLENDNDFCFGYKGENNICTDELDYDINKPFLYNFPRASVEENSCDITWSLRLKTECNSSEVTCNTAGGDFLPFCTTIDGKTIVDCDAENSKNRIVEVLRNLMERKLDLISWMWSESKDTDFVANAGSENSAYKNRPMGGLDEIAILLQRAGENSLNAKFEKIKRVYNLYNKNYLEGRESSKDSGVFQKIIADQYDALADLNYYEASRFEKFIKNIREANEKSHDFNGYKEGEEERDAGWGYQAGIEEPAFPCASGLRLNPHFIGDKYMRSWEGKEGAYLSTNERNCVYSSIWVETRDYYFSGILKDDSYVSAGVERFNVKEIAGTTSNFNTYEIYRKRTEEFSASDIGVEKVTNTLNKMVHYEQSCFYLSAGHKSDLSGNSLHDKLKESNKYWWDWTNDTDNWNFDDDNGIHQEDSCNTWDSALMRYGENQTPTHENDEIEGHMYAHLGSYAEIRKDGKSLRRQGGLVNPMIPQSLFGFEIGLSRKGLEEYYGKQGAPIIGKTYFTTETNLKNNILTNYQNFMNEKSNEIDESGCIGDLSRSFLKFSPVEKLFYDHNQPEGLETNTEELFQEQIKDFGYDSIMKLYFSDYLPRYQTFRVVDGVHNLEKWYGQNENQGCPVGINGHRDDVKCPVIKGEDTINHGPSYPIGDLSEIEAIAWWLFYYKLEESKALSQVAKCYRAKFETPTEDQGSGRISLEGFQSIMNKNFENKQECKFEGSDSRLTGGSIGGANSAGSNPGIKLEDVLLEEPSMPRLADSAIEDVKSGQIGNINTKGIQVSKTNSKKGTSVSSGASGKSSAELRNAKINKLQQAIKSEMNRRREVLKSKAADFGIPFQSVPVTTDKTAIGEILSSVGRVSTPGYVSGGGSGVKLAKLSSTPSNKKNDGERSVQSISKISAVGSKKKSSRKNNLNMFKGYGGKGSKKGKRNYRGNSKIINEIEKNKEKYKVNEQDPIFERITKAYILHGYQHLLEVSDFDSDQGNLIFKNKQKNQLSEEQKEGMKEMELLKKLNSKK